MKVIRNSTSEYFSCKTWISPQNPNASSVLHLPKHAHHIALCSYPKYNSHIVHFFLLHHTHAFSILFCGVASYSYPLIGPHPPPAPSLFLYPFLHLILLSPAPSLFFCPFLCLIFPALAQGLFFRPMLGLILICPGLILNSPGLILISSGLIQISPGHIQIFPGLIQISFSSLAICPQPSGECFERFWISKLKSN